VGVILKNIEDQLYRSQDTPLQVIYSSEFFQPGIFLLHFLLDENGDSDTWFSAAAPRSANPLICHIAPKGNRAKQLLVKSLSLGGKFSTRDRIAYEFAVTRPHEELACRPENPPEGDEDIHQALEAGATGHLIKGMPHEVFMEALRKVHARRNFLRPPVTRALASRMLDGELRTPEREVLVHGKSNREITDELSNKEATVKSHISVIRMRLDGADRTQAVVVALQRGPAHLWFLYNPACSLGPKSATWKTHACNHPICAP
jgi:DNA-binding CsgD family transcriptional regulator